MKEQRNNRLEDYVVPALHRFIDVIVPVNTCNLRCHYCYITHSRLFESELPAFDFSPDVFARSLSRGRLGGTCLFNFCGGGETLLPLEMVSYIDALLSEGHFVMVVTNGTVTKSFENLSKLPKEQLDRLMFKFSFHYLELKKRGLLARFCENVRMMRDAGASFSVEITPSDELIPFINEVKNISIKEFGALCHVTVARDEHDKSKLPILTKLSCEEYRRIWGSFSSPLFDFKMSVFGEKRRNFCYAGKWTYFLEMKTGLLFQCYGACSLQNIYHDEQVPIRMLPVGHFCPMPHCYNAHAFMSLGVIPNRKDPTYATLRNRVCADGSEWLKPRMKAFLSQKLGKNNDSLSVVGKVLADVKCLSVAGSRVARRMVKLPVRK